MLFEGTEVLLYRVSARFLLNTLTPPFVACWNGLF